MDRIYYLKINSALTNLKNYKEGEGEQAKPVLIDIDLALAIADNMDLIKPVISVCEEVEKRNMEFQQAYEKKRYTIITEKAKKNEDGSYVINDKKECVYETKEIETEVRLAIAELENNEGTEIKKAWEDYRKFQEEEVAEINLIKIKRKLLPKKATANDIIELRPIVE